MPRHTLAAALLVAASLGPAAAQAGPPAPTAPSATVPQTAPPTTAAPPTTTTTPPTTPPPLPTTTATPPPLPTAPAEAWFVEQGGQRHGPMDAAAVTANIQSGALLGSNLAWRQGMGAWTPISQLPEFTAALAAAPPPLPTADASRAQLAGTWERSQEMGPMMQRLRVTLNADGTYRSRGEMCARAGIIPICSGDDSSGAWTSQLTPTGQYSINAGRGMDSITGTWTVVDPNTLRNETGSTLRRVG